MITNKRLKGLILLAGAVFSIIFFSFFGGIIFLFAFDYDFPIVDFYLSIPLLILISIVILFLISELLRSVKIIGSNNK